jgi:hypothetical protein
MFSLGLQVSGNPFAALVPIPVGPRKQDQSWLGKFRLGAGALTAANARERVTSPEQTNKIAKVFMEKHPHFRTNMLQPPTENPNASWAKMTVGCPWKLVTSQIAVVTPLPKGPSSHKMK